MYGLLESVPNFSEGRDAVVIEAIRAAMVDAGGRVLDVHSDADHNRSVFTVVADADSLVDALAAAISVAVARIDLRSHEGVHPRVGAADVVPLVRFDPEDDAERAARALTRRIAMLGVPALGSASWARGRRPASSVRAARNGWRSGWRRARSSSWPARRSCTRPPAPCWWVRSATAGGVQHRPRDGRHRGRAGDRVRDPGARRRLGRRAGARPAGSRRAQVRRNLIDVEGTPLAAASRPSTGWPASTARRSRGRSWWV